MTPSVAPLRCNSAELSLLRHHAANGFVAAGQGPGSISPDARDAVAAGLVAKGLVDARGTFTPLAWSTLWSNLPAGKGAAAAIQAI